MISRILFPFFLILISIIGFLSWQSRAISAPPSLASNSERIDHIVVEKAARSLSLYRGGALVKRYSIKLGFAPVGQKAQEGDGKTPEGIYRINRRNGRSKYHLSLGLDYPLPAQRRAAKAKGINPGGDIFIHGQPNQLKNIPLAPSRLPHDWTDGCVALSNDEIEEIWKLTPIGTKVEILP
ncbi:MAG: L,D-transpeptidase [Cohaesibacter sp.]|jgi:murein L,D-transpeptidase YafK|nr:L,D-transpeptidase [Cohaesibacter sp.]